MIRHRPALPLIVEAHVTDDGRVIGYGETTWHRPVGGLLEPGPELRLPVRRDGEQVGAITQLARFGHSVFCEVDFELEPGEALCADTDIDTLTFTGADEPMALSGVRIIGAIVCPVEKYPWSQLPVPSEAGHWT